MSKMLTVSVVFIIVGIYVFLNLGKFVDQTQPPMQSDIIVALGGDYSGCRLKKALELYKEGYSASKKFIYTSRDSVSKSLDSSGSRRIYLLKHGIKAENIINVDRSMISNTMEEVLFLKKYMLYHHYKSLLIVSHPQHSRRIKALARYIAHYPKYGLQLRVVSCEPGWWNANEYYKNKIALAVTLKEIEKLVYNLMKYSPLLVDYTAYAKQHKSTLWKKDIMEKLN